MTNMLSMFRPRDREDFSFREDLALPLTFTVLYDANALYPKRDSPPRSLGSAISGQLRRRWRS